MKNRFSLLLFAASLSFPVFSQNKRFDVGLVFTPAMTDAQTIAKDENGAEIKPIIDDMRRPTLSFRAGLFVEAKLARGFAIRLGGQYSMTRLARKKVAVDLDSIHQKFTPVDRWELLLIPADVVYHLKLKKLEPVFFVGAAPSFLLRYKYLWKNAQPPLPTTVSTDKSIFMKRNTCLEAGAGITLPLWHGAKLELSPTARYMLGRLHQNAGSLEWHLWDWGLQTALVF